MNAHTTFPVASRRYRILRRPPESIRPSTPRPVRRDCHGRLIAALTAFAGDGAEIDGDGVAPWASATFIGARHRIDIVVADAEQARTLTLALPEAEFALPRHIVADIGIVSITEEAPDRHRIALSVLTIESW